MGSCLSTEKVVNSSAHGMSKKNLKREAREVLAIEAKNDEQLACFPGRMCTNGSSNSSCMFSQQGRKGINQDAMVVWEGFASREDTTFCGVFDGHGPYGHLVARRVRDSLPLKLAVNWQESTAAQQQKQQQIEDETFVAEEEEEEEKKEEEEEDCELLNSWEELHLKAFRVMDRELQVHPSIDCFCSGTTAVTVIKQGQHIYIGNVGDSRAILGTLTDNGSLTPLQLTVDLKPNLPLEAERITQCKGRVFALHDEPEVHRVWLPNENSPGLAMARAFGDFCLKDFGVIAVPEFYHRRLTHKDKFLVLATDGVWDVLSNEDVVKMVSLTATRSSAARTIVEGAVHAWMLKYPTSKIDDCAAVCLYLDKPTPPSSHHHHHHLHHHLQQQQQQPTAAKDDDDDDDVEKPADVEGNVDADVGGDVEKKKKEKGSEWSALEGITRVNSLLSLPRFLLGDKRLGGSKRRR